MSLPSRKTVQVFPARSRASRNCRPSPFFQQDFAAADAKETARFASDGHLIRKADGSAGKGQRPVDAVPRIAEVPERPSALAPQQDIGVFAEAEPFSVPVPPEAIVVPVRRQIAAEFFPAREAQQGSAVPEQQRLAVPEAFAVKVSADQVVQVALRAESGSCARFQFQYRPSVGEKPDPAIFLPVRAVGAPVEPRGVADGADIDERVAGRPGGDGLSPGRGVPEMGPPGKGQRFRSTGKGRKQAEPGKDMARELHHRFCAKKKGFFEPEAVLG